MVKDGVITAKQQAKRFTIVTFCNWDTYNGQDAEEKPSDKPSVSQPQAIRKPYSNKDKKERSKENFIPPSVEDVQKRISEMGYHFSAESFVAHYASKGWLVGKNRMRDWTAACVTWERNWQERNGTPAPGATGRRFEDTLPRL